MDAFHPCPDGDFFSEDFFCYCAGCHPSYRFPGGASSPASGVADSVFCVIGIVRV